MRINNLIPENTEGFWGEKPPSGRVQVEDVFYMLGIIYNDVEHVWENGVDKPAIYKLDNLAVKNIISRIFKFNGNPITIDSIH